MKKDENGYAAAVAFMGRLLRSPEEPPLELEGAEVTQKVPLKRKHGRLQWIIASFLDDYTLSRIPAMAFPELRAIFADRSYEHGVLLYRWTRIPVGKSGGI